MSQHATSDSFNHEPQTGPNPATQRPPPHPAPGTSSAGGSTSPTNGPKQPSTATWPRTAAAKSARSCSPWPKPRAATRRTGSQLLGDHAGRPRPASSAASSWASWPATSARSLSWPSPSGPKAGRRTPPTPPRPRPWSPTNRSTRKSFAGSPPGAATGWRAPSARPSSAPTTGWSATCPWSWAWPPPASAVPWSCSAVSPGCWPGRCPWEPANSFPCAPSVNSWRRPAPPQITLAAAPSLDIEHNELLLVYLARGMSREARRAPRRGADGPA